MKSSSVTKRDYVSPLREKQATDTRAAIIAALLEQVSDESLADFSIPKVAERAGVAVRTVYRYFPTRDDLLQAVRDNWAKKTDMVSPTSIADMPGHVGRLFQRFEENVPGVMAALQTRLGKEARGASRAPRLRAIQKTIADDLPHLSEGERRGFYAVVRALMSADGWRTMREHVGAEHVGDAAAATEWALAVLVREAKKKNDNQAPTKKRAKKGVKR